MDEKNNGTRSSVNDGTGGPGLGAIRALGGISAVLMVLAVSAELAITMLPGGNETIDSAAGWLTLLGESPLMGLRNLGLINIIFISLGFPLYFALYLKYETVDGRLAGFALILNLVGVAVFLSTNRAFPMLELSRQYALAGTDSQKLMLESAAGALLAVGGSHTPGTFAGFFAGELSGLLMSIAMLRTGKPHRTAGIAGIIGFSLLAVFEIFASFVTGINGPVLALAAVGGLLNMAWLILVAAGFFRTDRNRAA